MLGQAVKKKGLKEHPSRQEGQHFVEENRGLLVAKGRVLKQAVGQVPFSGRKGTDEAVLELLIGVSGVVFKAVHQVQDGDQHIVGQAGEDVVIPLLAGGDALSAENCSVRRNQSRGSAAQKSSKMTRGR